MDAPMGDRYPFASHESDIASSVRTGSSSSGPQLGTNLLSSETHSSYPYSRYSSIQHSPIRLERSQSADTPLDHEALQILDSLLKDLDTDRQSEHSHAAFGESTGSTSAGTIAQDLRRKGSRQWWEPQSFDLLPYVPPWNQKTGRIDWIRNDDPHLRDQVNAQLFAGKLSWAPDADLDHVPASNFREVSPFKKYHRILPFVQFTDQDGSQLPIRMTEHNNAPVLSSGPDSVLRNRPFYLLWSARRLPDGRRRLINHGAAYTNTVDNGEIDDHLRSLYRDAARIPFAH